MKFSVSNIGWSLEQDEQIYCMMQKHGISGLEIAPTRIFPEMPYEKIAQAAQWSKSIFKQYGFVVSSMQSIWYGRQERIFGTPEERAVLIDYTKKAIDFAEAVGCKNLVFGCPKNRSIEEGEDSESAISFFRELGEYAWKKGAVLAMEANPPIYNTNYINDTLSALALVKKVASKGFLLNLDIGTMIQNQEVATELIGKVKYIHHVHISEPGLKPIQKRELHKELMKVLKDEEYQGFLSIEMGKPEKVSTLEDALCYVRSFAE